MSYFMIKISVTIIGKLLHLTTSLRLVLIVKNYNAIEFYRRYQFDLKSSMEYK